MPRIVDMNGLRVLVEAPAHANRPPMLLVHGMFGGAWQFENYQRFFAARGWSTYAVELRSHHGSRPVPDLGNVSVSDYVADALEVARALTAEHGRPPVTIGHSMGGLITQKLAEAGAIVAAVLLCSAPPRGVIPFGPTLLRRMVPHLGNILRGRPLVASREDADALMFNRTPVEERDAQFEQIVPESGRAAREMALGLVGVDARRVRVPLLSVGSADDQFVHPRVARALARRYNGTLLEFARHGHHILLEPGWERAAEAIDHWLAQTVLGTEAPAPRPAPRPAPADATRVARPSGGLEAR